MERTPPYGSTGGERQVDGLRDQGGDGRGNELRALEFGGPPVVDLGNLREPAQGADLLDWMNQALRGTGASGLVAPATLPALAVPELVANRGDAAAWRYVEFFTANIRNPNTRRAYARACGRFLAWCGQRGLTLASIRPFDVAAYLERLQAEASAPSVKQQLAAIRML